MPHQANEEPSMRRRVLKEIKIAILGRGQIFGEQDVLTDSENSSLKLTCCSNVGSIFAMNRDEFSKRFKHGSDAWNVLMGIAIAKEKAVIDKINQVKGSQNMISTNTNDEQAKKKVEMSALTKKLHQTANLRPSSPDYYDIRLSMQKIINKLYTNDSLLTST